MRGFPIPVAVGRQPTRQSPTPLWYRRPMNRKREFLPSTFRIAIDTVGAQGTAETIQSSADSESIEPTTLSGFSPPLCPLGHSGKKATSCETGGYEPAGIARSGASLFAEKERGPEGRVGYCVARATATTGSIDTGMIPAVFMSS